MKFTQFLFEGAKEDIIVILNDMTQEEIQAFGDWLYGDFFEYDEVNDDKTELGESDESDDISKEELIELLGNMSADELSFILDQLDYDDDEDTTDHHDENNPNIQNEELEGLEGKELEEAVSRRMKSKDRNKRVRKFMGKSKADMRRTKVARKKEARKNRAKTKRTYRANKVKKLAYSASRTKAIKSGKHKVKLRRKA